jgi:hypothetical protein
MATKIKDQRIYKYGVIAIVCIVAALALIFVIGRFG